ncbi:MAG: AsmA family protein, partial [Rhizobacter sp.]|nr:AsmA family protein [Rhizobacter sp.]
DRSRPFASLAAATLVFSWRSVAERRLVVALMVLRDGEVDFERRSDGLRNWRLGHPDDRGPGQLRLLAIGAERAVLRVRHEPLALDLEVRTSANADPGGAAAPDGDTLPVRLDARGTWSDVPFAIDAATSETITLLETGHSARVRGRLEAGGARLDVDGRLGDIVRWPQVEASVELAGESLPRLLALLAGEGATVREPAREPFSVAGMLRGDSRGYTLAPTRGRVGASDVAGEVRWLRGDERNTLQAELRSETLDLADLHALAARAGTPVRAVAKGGAAAAVRAAEHAASAPAARAIAVDVRFAARRVRAVGLPTLHDAALEASFMDGVLRIGRLALALGGGRVTGKGSVVLEVPLRADGEIDVAALPVETLLGESAAKHQLSGVLRGRAALRASGETIEAMLASASGTLSGELSQGTISSLLDAEMGLQGGRMLKSLLRGAEPIALRCAAAVVEVRSGRGTIRSLVVDSARTHTSGSGSVDLARRTLDVLLTPEAKQSGLFILDRSIRIHGPIAGPARELVARSARPASASEGCKPG